MLEVTSKMWKKTWNHFWALSLVILFTGIAFASTKWIGNDGGVVKMRNGVELVIPPDALDEEVKIQAHMSSRQIIDEEGSGRKLLVFTFEPSGTTFNKPAEIHIDKDFFEEEDADDIVICHSDEEKSKEPRVKDNGSEFIIYIKDFSYYFRRRR